MTQRRRISAPQPGDAAGSKGHVSRHLELADREDTFRPDGSGNGAREHHSVGLLVRSRETSPTAGSKARQRRRAKSLDDVPGWFSPLDQLLFHWLLVRQHDRGYRGDLLEMGTYLGKSAIILGRYLRPGETLTVCDLFEAPAADDANVAEIASYFPLATRHQFEHNYLEFHDTLPRVLQASTAVVLEAIGAATCRFAHVDDSHLYAHVSSDIGAVEHVLGAGGIVAIDNFRAEHTPGVALATWEAVLTRGLRPVCVSAHKFYGTWADPRPIQDELLTMLPGVQCLPIVEDVAGHRLIRVAEAQDMVLAPGDQAKAPVEPDAGE